MGSLLEKEFKDLLMNIKFELSQRIKRKEKALEENTAKLLETNTLLKKEIDKRNESEKNLRRSEKTLQTILDSLPVSVVIIDKEKKFGISIVRS